MIRIPPCVDCGRNTPRFGETVCENCQERLALEVRHSDAVARYWAYIPDVQDEAARKCLEALYTMITGEPG